jgi:RNA polymerase sigma-70 factor (ECF subfamily)
LAAEDLSDHQLLERFLDGDGRSFDVLMRRHEDRIFALAYRITGNRADALEATQDTFLSVLRAASSFRGGSEVSTWLYRIGINAARDALRRRRRAPVPEEQPEVLDAVASRSSSMRMRGTGSAGPQGVRGTGSAGPQGVRGTGSAGPQDLEEVVAARVDLARALASLPEDYREAVVMHDVGGIPYDEIARVTGVALGTVKSRISRGRRLLAQRLEHRSATPASKDS